MRVITEMRVKMAMEKYPQWRIGLQLWLLTYRKADVKFESFQQIKSLWKSQSGWNVDRVPAKKIKDSAFLGENFDLYIFDVHGTNCRIITRIDSSNGKIFIREVLSHAEYDKWIKANVK